MGNAATVVWLINTPNSSQKIRVPKFWFQINVSGSVSIITIDVEDDHKALIHSYIYVYRLQADIGPSIIYTYMYIYISGEGNGKLPPRTFPGCSVPEPYRSHDWALVPASPDSKAEY